MFVEYFGKYTHCSQRDEAFHVTDSNYIAPRCLHIREWISTYKHDYDNHKPFSSRSKILTEQRANFITLTIWAVFMEDDKMVE
jgi:hypothetical protein